ncbi:MAG TPA: LamG-like jellyroll fold domain-containing protein [Terriglobales bacterium]|nr:LamG-like jellyroll fold domain-containing protein [Terriglobales bacterium]
MSAAGRRGVRPLARRATCATLSRARLGAGLVALAIVIALVSCTRPARSPDVTARNPGTPVDSATVALWRMDETGGTRVADAGPHHLDAVAGLETRTVFGRFAQARQFGRSNDSFLYVAPNPALDATGPLTIDCWVDLATYSPYEASPIAARWSPSTIERSWIFAIVGSNLDPSLWPSDLGQPPGPQWLAPYVKDAGEGRLLFLYQPADAGMPLAFSSLTRLPLNRWTLVAVTFDGQTVRFWVDGRSDGTYAVPAGLRSSQAPLLVGNLFDTRFLTDFGGDLRQGPAGDAKPWYAFEGGIDELRISNVARTLFPLHGGK